MFTHTSFAQGKAAVAGRLQDTGFIHWLDAEVGLYLKEALQAWNLAALYHRDRVTLNTVVGTKFYDLQSAVNGSAETPLARTVTDRDLVNSLQYALLEAVNVWGSSTAWNGTSMFTMNDLQSALQRRLNQLLFETGVTVTESQQVVVPADGRVDLSQSILDVIRAAWVTLDNVGNESTISRLSPIDESTAGKQSRLWSLSPDRPQGFSIAVTPNLQMQLIPPPSDTGKLHLLTVDANANLDVTAGVTLNIANDLTPVLNWGARADLLGRDSESQDVARAQYAEKRWQEGVELAKLFASAMNAESNGVPVQLCDISDFDNHSYRWQSTSGRPSVLAMAGLNLLAPNLTPDDIYSVTLDVVRNAILPVADVDYLQIGKEFLDPLYDYTVHLALFKEGAKEVQDSMGLYTNFMKAAAEYNSKLKNHAPAFDVLVSREYRDDPIRVAA